ncbi:FolC bifunctional protein [Epithele typhae]|uniref:FolC bifunctional protein n=1 Tax=Epithele typhae TaxID=378194 RepID=UPI002007253E|nr:FolC bifunctional protein [Epithele typhae]KAH9943381.1 FolC bifunctional protein [Epithele typhae]
MTSRSYRDAVDCLNSLQSNAATLEAVRASGGRLSEFAIPEMIEYLQRIGHNLNQLNVIHITGTKGKGSTSAFVDSLLRTAHPEWKVGLYTSPHLVAVRERIRVGGAPLSEDVFTKYFFEVWDRLKANTKTAHPQTPIMPGYFRFLTLLAYHTFLDLKVRTYAWKLTNIVPKPIVTGITALGIDHVNVLGKTLREIAWQKGGIFKKGVPALTVEQPEDALEVLKGQAIELELGRLFVPAMHRVSETSAGLSGSHQYQNATLAVHLAKRFLTAQTSESYEAELPAILAEGLQKTKWPGRCQTVFDPARSRVTWFLDGAHTRESLDCCMDWFVSPDTVLRAKETTLGRTRVLIFNCTNGRSGGDFLGGMLAKATEKLKALAEDLDAKVLFDRVIFCANVTYANGGFKGDLTTKAIATDDLAQLKTQNELASAWLSLVPLFPKEHVHVLPSIEHAVNVVNDLGTDQEVDVLVAGSLHLVGGLIEVAGLSDVAL